ncbi:serine hydrolase [Salinibacterium sp. SWN139]|uniref:serine hydrolase n=1 Tax=Salinibacterium sp. SWN139 TaxID=2792055 RepID=UPI0018CDC951|nr:serine hydrolase [Salinibacterium sp. SWN139]MBH0054371.1 serine hydrolase [Salinibacterium sp. SWN139]
MESSAKFRTVRRSRTAPAMVALLAVSVAVSGCTAAASGGIEVIEGDSPASDVIALSAGSSDVAVVRAVDAAVEQLPELAAIAMDETGTPGLAIAVVHNGEMIYADGFGVREAGTADRVDADTVFQIASVSKSLSATVVARAITQDAVEWDTPVRTLLSDFSLADSYVTQNATIGDYFSHRTGLATGAGDDLEDVGYDRDYILDHLRYQPLDDFRSSYHYSNYGITVGAEATAAALGMDWNDAIRELVYEPLGMTATSSSYADFVAQPNRATLHTFVDGEFQPLFERNPDPQSPAGGVSSTVGDLSKWMTMILSGGEQDGQPFVTPESLVPAITAQSISSQASAPDQRTGSYGYGFNVGSQAGGRTTVSHSGGFVLGAGTNYQLVPSLDLGIVTLTNAAPIGTAEAINAQFLDLVQYGEVQRDWLGDYSGALSALNAPAGDLVGETKPGTAGASLYLSDYEGTYRNGYFGDLVVTEVDGALQAALGPRGNYLLELEAWDADTFAFTPTGENAPHDSLSSATFSRSGGAVTGVTLEFFDAQGLGEWRR